LFIQNGRGRRPAQEQWVFGMVDTSTSPSVGYMELVQDRTAATLTSIISAHVAPGTEIWSDQWSSYRRVASLPGITAHHTVNHSVQFVTGTFYHGCLCYYKHLSQQVEYTPTVLRVTGIDANQRSKG